MKIKEALEGTGKVFSFTLRQLLRIKGNRILLVILLIASLASVPVLSLVSGKTGEEDPYLACYEKAGIDEETMELLQAGLTADSMSFESFLEDEPYEDDFDMDSYNVQFIYSVAVMMICVLSASYVVTTVIEEKSSKLVDLLLVSVKPAALLLGKVLAALAFVVISILLLIAGTLVSYAVSGLLMDVSAVKDMLTGLLQAQISADAVIFMLLSALFGYFLMGMLSGVMGAGCSGADEASGALSTSMVLVMGAYFLSIFGTSFSSSESLAKALCLIPVVSMMTAPVQYLQGNIGAGVMALSLLFALLAAVLMLLLAVRVYRYLIVYKGNRLKLKQILQLAFGRKKEGRSRGGEAIS